MYLEDWGPHSHFLFPSVAGSCVKVKKGITQSRAFMIWFHYKFFYPNCDVKTSNKNKTKTANQPPIIHCLYFNLTVKTGSRISSIKPSSIKYLIKIFSIFQKDTAAIQDLYFSKNLLEKSVSLLNVNAKSSFFPSFQLRFAD